MVTPQYNRVKDNGFFFLEQEGKYRKTSIAFAFTHSCVKAKYDTEISTHVGKASSTDCLLSMIASWSPSNYYCRMYSLPDAD